MDGLAKPGERLAVLHIGGGAFTLPMYVAATRPGSVNKVMEIDPAVVDTARADFGLRSGPRLQVEVGDAGVLTTRERPLSYDFIVGDAFSSRSPPWQLTTREFLGRLRKLLRPRGAYLMNVIDDGRAFVRAEAATMQRVFPHVVVLELPGETNHVLVGANAPIDVAALRRQAMRMGVPVLPLTGASLGQLIGDAHVLENDFAPVDQLLNAGGSPVVAQR
jgi:spermidine synthase